MQHADDQQCDRPAQVKDRTRAVDNPPRLPQIAQHELRTLIRGQQRSRMRGHYLVVVHIHDPHVRIDRLRDLMNVLPGREPGPEIEELVDSRLGGRPHYSLHERAIGASVLPNARLLREKFLGQRPVDRVIVLAARVLP
jgi:hypothetical protein